VDYAASRRDAMSDWVPPHYKDKSSPGPWKWVPFRNWDGGLQAADGSYVISNDETDNTPENPHDAVLIAKAPDLLAMLRRLEWTTWNIRYDATCPVCAQRKSSGQHAPGCDLATLLRDLP